MGLAVYPRSKVIKNRDIPQKLVKNAALQKFKKLKIDKILYGQRLANLFRRTFEPYPRELIHEILAEPKPEEKRKLVDVREMAPATGMSVSHLTKSASHL